METVELDFSLPSGNLIHKALLRPQWLGCKEGLRVWRVCLQPVASIWMDEFLPKYCAISVFLSKGHWTSLSLPPLLQTWYHFCFITCSLLLILPIRLLSLTQLLSTHSVLSSPSCLFILLMALSYQFRIQKKGWLPPSCVNCWSSCTSLLMLNAVKYQYPVVISYKSEMGQLGLGETLAPESWYKTCCALVMRKVFGVFSCFYLPDVAFWKPDVSTIFFCVPAAPFPPAACSNSQFINGFLNLLKYY